MLLLKKEDLFLRRFGLTDIPGLSYFILHQMILSRSGETPAVVCESTAACYGIMGRMVRYPSHNISLGHAHQQQSSDYWFAML